MIGSWMTPSLWMLVGCLLCFPSTNASFVAFQQLNHAAPRKSTARNPTTLALATPRYSEDSNYRNQNSHEITHDGDFRVVSTKRRDIVFAPLLKITTIPFLLPPTSFAFEGGVGGLGKTKPQVGVELMNGSVPVQNKQGVISAEIVLQSQEVARINFQTPWPLLETAKSGLEARNLRQAESAFVQVVEQSSKKETIPSIITNKVLGSQGKFGAYGTPSDIRVKQLDQDLYSVTFTTLTPSMIESDRKILVKVQQFNANIILLVTGTTAVRFKSQQDVLQKVADSFQAVLAPPRK